MSEEDKMKKILDEYKTIAVVGLSPKEHRVSHSVSAYLQNNGYKIIPVYPREEIILGEKVYRKLTEIPVKVDTVLIFRKSEEVLAVVEEAVKIKPKAIWMQEGIINREACELAEKNGIITVMDECMYKQHVRL